ncbi:hypothetical protein FJT64_011314 [Amphibalanus amphitrite]|uniref:Uncharacterized protein n=1 Tax=Amphibalanus amphitrite TaxID=1232801 RepID=A0A6A4VJG0_AMPAM|nr:uncharacterized protein LOC122384782 [Amphibalanus amphitrite]KAF0290488.1 hypothetical protein FJT64_011314 [Amphibalanus amphitrite]
MNVSGKRKPSSSSSKSEEDDIPRIREPESGAAAASDTAAPAEPEGAVGASAEPSQPVPQQLPPPSTAGMWPGARQGTRTKTSHQKKKKNVVSVDQPPEVKDEPVTGSARPRQKQREPLPMKLRALPQSFWLQPNDNSTSPNTGSLPPLVTTSKDAQDINDVAPITPPDQRSLRRSPEQTRSVSEGNPDLLFSLFDAVSHAGEKKRITLWKRNKSKKPSSTDLPHDEDPYMSSSATESILPLLPDRSSGSGTPSNRGTQILSVVQIPGTTDRETICLPSLSVEHNYANILSQLVMKL